MVQKIDSIDNFYKTDQDCPYAYGAANPYAGNAGIPQDGQHPPLPPRL
jgi:hypothetical protein